MENNMIRVIVKAPGEEVGHFEDVENTLKGLQNIVGGPIETLYIESGLVMVVNAEGKLWMLPKNFKIFDRDIIVGTAMITGTCGDDFADCPISLERWEELLKDWREEK